MLESVIKNLHCSMRVFFFLIVSVCCAVNALGQTEEIPQAEMTVNDMSGGEMSMSAYDTPSAPIFYKSTAEWKKFKIMRAVGWSAFGVGLATVAFGGLYAAAVAVDKGDLGWPGVALFAGGGGLMVASVPILIVGYRYKHKAERLKLDVGLGALRSVDRERFSGAPALQLRFTF